MKRIFLGNLFLLLLAAACASLPPLLPPEDYLAALQQHSPPSSLQGTGVISMSTPEGSGTLRFAFLTSPPDSLRIDAVGPFGNLAFLLVQAAGQIEMYLPGEGRYLVGNQARNTLAAYLPPEVSPQELIFFLSGRLPGSFWKNESITVTPTKREIRCSFGDGAERGEARFSRRDLILRRFEFASSPGREPCQVSFARYRKEDGFPLPTRIRLQAPRPEGTIHLRIEVNEFTVHPELMGNPFQIFPPGS